MNLPVLGRSCGDCSACCTVLGIPELGKPYYQRCRRLSDAGCERYTQRPDSCRNYHCVYLQGLSPERPNQTGVLFDLAEGNLLGVFETIAGAWDRPDVQTEVARVAAEIFKRSTYIGIVLHRFDRPVAASYKASPPYVEPPTTRSLDLEAIGLLSTPAGDLTVYQPI